MLFAVVTCEPSYKSVWHVSLRPTQHLPGQISFLDYCMPPVHGGALPLYHKWATYNESSLRPPGERVWGDQTDTLTDIFRSASAVIWCRQLFRKFLNNPAHVMFPILPWKKDFAYNLRARAHQCIFTVSSTAASKNFIQRMVFTHWLLYSFTSSWYYFCCHVL